ncbi:hypothetical protein CGCVW01_v011459 [Colletotrichum viniferum]|nr:hypothetical protein CGCVW01_v011459 [Colletotrichum viniferum]
MNLNESGSPLLSSCALMVKRGLPELPISISERSFKTSQAPKFMSDHKNRSMELIANLIIILIAIRQALAAGGFNDSCSEVRYWDPDSIYGRKNQASPYIVARCMESGKKERCSWLPLTVCFSNDDGVFGYRKK